MQTLKKYYEYVLVSILTGFVFFITKFNNIDRDTFFHIKAGEIFTQKGIIFHDIFSFSQYGKQWIPYEWLFQIGIYFVVQIFGLGSLGFWVGMLSAIQVVFLYFLIKKIFSLPSWINFLICILYSLGNFFFFVPRPTIVANIFFLISAYVLFVYLYKGKNYLWVSIPVFLLWLNSHASFIMAFYLYFSYVAVCVGCFFVKRQKEFLHKAKILGIYGTVLVALSFLPPLFGEGYTLLLLFAKHPTVLNYIAEWQPLFVDINSFVLYTVLLVFLATFFFVIRKRVTQQEILFVLPMVFLLFIPYLALRNELYGFFAIAIVLAFITVKLQKIEHRRLVLGFFSAILGIFIILWGIIAYVYFKALPNQLSLPEKAASFILQSHLKGNMYNSYGYGGYLLYRLYPQQKVFIDGRTDVYLCCELPASQILDNTPPPPIQQYRKIFFSVLDRYHISFALIDRTINGSIKAQVLYDNPDWVLVYWDDNAQIFVRKNDLNNSIIQQLGLHFVAPYAAAEYDPNHLMQSEEEVKRMIHITDSAKARDILGAILIQENRTNEAAANFKKAIDIEPFYTPPYLNLAYILAKEGNYELSQKLYERALLLGSTQPSAYIYLGEVYIQEHNTSKAREVWTEGLQAATNPADKSKLQQLLTTFAF